MKLWYAMQSINVLLRCDNSIEVETFILKSEFNSGVQSYTDIPGSSHYQMCVENRKIEVLFWPQPV